MTEEDFYYSLSLKSYEVIKGTYDSLEEKNTKIMTSVLIILPIIAGVGYFIFENNTLGFPVFSYLFSVYLFIIVVILSTLCAFPKQTIFVNSLLFYNEYYGNNLDDLKEQASVNIGSVIEPMSIQVNIKAFYIKCELVVFILGIIMLSLSMMFSVLG